MHIKYSDMPRVIVQELGSRLKRARLNKNLTQSEVAEKSGVERRTVINAEKGKVTLEDFVIIMDALGMIEHLNSFMPPQLISPIQLHKMRGKVRKRASGNNKQSNKVQKAKEEKDLGG